VHQALCAAVGSGVTAVVAAGNDASDARKWIPASYDEAITVSAIGDFDGRPGGDGGGCGGTLDDRFAHFSNYGLDVDITAPGVCILSTLRGGGYGYSSGTSMATPAVAGGAALYLSSRPGARPAQVRLALIEAGSHDWATGSDRDSVHEPILDVASFALDPAFTYTARPSSLMRSAGETARYELTVARVGGHDAPIDFSVSGLPPNATATFDPSTAGPDRQNVTLTVDVPNGADQGTYPLRISGQAGARTIERTVQLVVTAPLPDSGGPAPRFVEGSTMSQYAMATRVSWRSVSGATRYQLQLSSFERPWGTLPLPSARATSVDRTAWPGTSVRYRVRAERDGAWLPWVTGPVMIPKPHHERGYGIDYTGRWSDDRPSDAIGERLRSSTDPGATATLRFTGRRVAWVAQRGPDRGRARVYIDGVHVRTVDLLASTRQPRRVVFSHGWASRGEHVIRIEVVGTAGRPRVTLDGIPTLE
jgi:hypothetical protein